VKKSFLRNAKWEIGIEEAARALLAGRHRHVVLENAIHAVEADESADTVGFGGFPNIAGEVELDAGFMNGDDRAVGTVAAIKHFLPVRIARRVMESNLHTFLVSEGAERFARGCGLKEQETLSPAQKEKWQRNIKPQFDRCVPGALMNLVEELARPVKKDFDTVVMIANDGNGLSAATSTSGWPYKFPGRVGDSPIAGAGFYVDSAWGGCVCTHTGEMSIRSGTAQRVVDSMEAGKSVQEAVDRAIDDLMRLRTGVLRGLCIHAIDREGKERVVALNIDSPEPVRYQYWREGMARPECRAAEILKL
jgi:L-asparaginase